MDIYIYMIVKKRRSQYVNESRYLYYSGKVTREMYRQIQDYIREFNDYANSYEEKYKRDEYWTKITFALKKQPWPHVKKIRPDQIIEYFHEFVNMMDLEFSLKITPFLLGWSKELVDDIFGLDYVRQNIPYDHWVNYKYYFQNNDVKLYVVIISFPLSQTHIAEKLESILNNLVERTQKDFIINLDGPMIFDYHSFSLEETNNTNYDQEDTAYLDAFFFYILPFAQDKELNFLVRIPDFENLIHREIQRRQKWSDYNLLRAQPSKQIT